MRQLLVLENSVSVNFHEVEKKDAMQMEMKTSTKAADVHK